MVLHRVQILLQRMEVLLSHPVTPILWVKVLQFGVIEGSFQLNFYTLMVLLAMNLEYGGHHLQNAFLIMKVSTIYISC